MVVDDAGVFGDQASGVNAAANQLVSSGADVRVRTIQTFGNAGNLDRYETQLEQQCPSWTDSSGTRKNNLIVIIVAIQERQTGLYYGSQWDNALGGQWTQIQSNTMNLRFAQGDFAGGVIAGLQQINRFIQTQPAVKQRPRTQRQPAVNRLPPALVVPWREQSLLTVIIAIIVIVALLLRLIWFRSYRKSSAKRQAARQKALLAKQGAASKVNQLVDKIQMLEIKVNATAVKVSPEDVAPLWKVWIRLKT